MTDRYLIVGLGNPGRDYEKTRHNVGFWVIDELVTRHALVTPTKERKALVYDGNINGMRVIVAKPQTYMNLSGESVRALLDFYKIPLERFIVVHDDLDIPLGTLRLRKDGSAGGQNGIKNIILHTGTQSFARVRFGIGRPAGKMQARDHVLQAFSGDDAILSEQVTGKCADAIETWLKEGMEVAMTQFNGGIQAPKDPKPDLSQEIAIAQRAHELSPYDVKPLETLARLYKKNRQLDETIASHLKLAELYEKLDKRRQMLAEWDNAVKIRPSLVELQIKIAHENEAQDDPKRATQAWLRLAEHHSDTGNLDGAMRAVLEALRINPQHPRAQELRENLQKRITG